MATPLDQNQFELVPILGMMDQRFNFNTKSCQVDATQVGTLRAGQSVKVVNSVGGVPKVIAVAADSDIVFGFIPFDIKDAGYVAGDRLEIAQAGNVIYLAATAAIARGVQVKGVVATLGGVATAVAASGSPIVGYTLDEAVSIGDLVRVELKLPSFTLA